MLGVCLLTAGTLLLGRAWCWSARAVGGGEGQGVRLTREPEVARSGVATGEEVEEGQGAEMFELNDAAKAAGVQREEAT